ncbi:hypothetical protein F4560_001082 [Saccharothrix ecbatanensis]|uniref:Uncharacterized protein n=1 Tax=Saccharothrix ecbatanensis TaxID=1105145 RepID=A0A7W9LYX3_9PSEU|nr:hypothetical protein [Saccharothrix ecbatanensis]MBB5801314.1 hypothetical protein [Saccharothrix ecbatanensis]
MTATNVRHRRLVEPGAVRFKRGRNEGARRRGVWALLLGLMVLLGGVLAMTAAAQPGTSAAPPTAADPCAGPGPYPVPCPTRPTTASTAVPSNPCLTPQPGQAPPSWCLPRPTTISSQPAITPTSAPPVRPAVPACGILNPSACVGEGIAGFLHLLVGESLNMLLGWVGSSLLSTPTLADLPRVGEIWEQSRLFVVAVYSLVVMLAGIVLMSHETVQTRYSVREIAPRVVVGFLAANLSLVIGDHAIRLANAASLAVLGDGLDPQTSGKAVTELFVSLVAGSIVTGGLFAGMLAVVLTVLLVALLVGYIVRVALTVILLAGAPLALMCHGLPQTEGLAQWFWRAGAGVLGIQVGQSLALICALKVFLQPGGFHFFGLPTADGLVNLVVLIALVWILVKIPGWVLRQVQVGGGGRRSFVGGLGRALVFGKAMGMLGGRSRGPRVGSTAGGAGHGVRAPRRRDPMWPAPVREWGGVDGLFTPEAIGRRLHSQRAQEFAWRRTVSGQQHLRFLQPAAQTPTHDLANWNPAGSTAAPEFRAAVEDTSPTSAEPLLRPVGRPTSPSFSAPGEGGGTATPRIRTAQVPPHLQFRPAVVEAPVRPVRAAAPPAVPVFQSSTPDIGAHGRRARTHTPAPALFHPPPSQPPAGTPQQAGERS